MENFEFKSPYGLLKGAKWEIDKPKAIIVIVTGMAEYAKRYSDFASFLNNNGHSVFSLDHFGQGENCILYEDNVNKEIKVNGLDNLINSYNDKLKQNNNLKNKKILETYLNSIDQSETQYLGYPIDDFFVKEIDLFHNFFKYLKETYNLKTYVFSHSMGSFLMQGYIEKYSNKYLDKLVLCGTNGKNFLIKFGAILSKLVVNDKNKFYPATLLHDLSIGAYEKAFKDRKDANDWLSYNEDNVKKYNEDKLCGYRCSNSFFKSFLSGLSNIQKNKNIKNSSKELNILIIGGADDPVGNFGKGLNNLFKLYSKFNLDVSLIIYEHARHEILNELIKDKVYQDILKFYQNS